jgi:hypothetical protein
MGRKTTAEVAIRRSDVRDMLMQGKGHQQIVATINTMYGVGRKAVEKDITSVYIELREYWARERDDVIAEHVARYEHIYRECLSIGDTKGAMQAMKQKEQLTKLLDDKPLVAVNNNTLNIDLSGMSLDDLKDAIK